MNQIISKVIEKINNNKVLEDSFTHPFNGEKIEINQDKFKTISSQSEEQTNPTKKITFIDGGSSTIFGSSNYSVAHIKLAYVTYLGKELVGREIVSFISYFDIFNKSVQSFLLEGDGELLLNLDNIQGESVEEMINNFRRLCELNLGKKVIDKTDILVIDGSLESKSNNENLILEEIKQSGKQIVGFSKSCSLITNKGMNVIDSVSSIVNNGENKYEANINFYLDTNYINNQIKITFAKLHPKSKNIFRVDFIGKNPLSSLLEQCTDAVFLGYPYGLVRVDAEARVSEHEKTILRTMFNSKIDLDNLEQSSNAHSKLDSVSF